MGGSTYYDLPRSHVDNVIYYVFKSRVYLFYKIHMREDGSLSGNNMGWISSQILNCACSQNVNAHRSILYCYSRCQFIYGKLEIVASEIVEI